MKGLPYLSLSLIAVLLIPPSPLDAQLIGPDAEPALGLWKKPSAMPVSYEVAETEEILAKLESVLRYLETASPIRIGDLETEKALEEGEKWPRLPGLVRGPFALVSYEWGVTYAGMLSAAEATGNEDFNRFVSERLTTIRELSEVYGEMAEDDRPERYPTKRLLEPHSLDHCGAMSAAMIKAQAAGVVENLDTLWQSGLHHVGTEQYRLEDGTLARNRPMKDSLWLDDLYMSVPALTQMAAYTGDSNYFDDAVRQMTQFSERMFIEEEGLYRHGWVQEMDPHPYFPWARANGWAFMANAELLSELPKDHPGYEKMLELFQAHAAGLSTTQGINGLWHQLLNEPGTYEETSASAMFVFGLAKGINEGWLDPLTYGPIASLGWNAVAEKINEEGQVEGTCVGTGMGWDKAFYAYRATSMYAAHGYGPVLLAGAEMIRLRQGLGSKARVHDGGVHFGETPDW
ncbi:glycoside hydrolase family 88/105 protein [Pelagicoccus albus]|uniref:Glycoside hydrolase family 88 protein n=1 Tax=Pelagicoccus albus TaxID=415222 RepID=A0A7X1B408_9BACT|nr:glycoside hydrolase family 88 protein [Pelagicoccus albus]MBC2605230.1 glycoside hydrolase family 88 protein [Pelagicoccus albus]